MYVRINCRTLVDPKCSAVIPYTPRSTSKTSGHSPSADRVHGCISCGTGHFPGPLPLCTLLLDRGSGAPGWPVQWVVATRASYSDVLSVLISGPDSSTWFPVTGHRTAFRMAQLEVQKLKADWGLLPLLASFHSSSPPPPRCVPAHPSRVMSPSRSQRLLLSHCSRFLSSHLGRPAGDHGEALCVSLCGPRGCWASGAGLLTPVVSSGPAAGRLPRCRCADRQALPHRGGHAEALQRWLRDLLQRLHLLPLGCHASDHAQR